MSERRRHARTLFAPLGPTYDRVGAALSSGRIPAGDGFSSPAPARRRARARRRDRHRPRRLAARRRGFRVTGVDQSARCSRARVAGFGGRVALVEARPTSSLRGRRRSTISPSPTSSATSTIPRRRCASWRGSSDREEPSRCSSSASPAGSGGRSGTAEVGVGLPLAGRLISPGWHEVGRFLGPSIRRVPGRVPEQALLKLWRDAGIADVRLAQPEPRRRSRRLGAARRVTASRARLLRARPGGWRDYVTLLHPPYTAWHLSYAVVGGCLAPPSTGRRWGSRCWRSPSRWGSARTPSTS